MGGPDGRATGAGSHRSKRDFRPISISKAPTSIAAGSTRRCSTSCMLNGVPPYKALLTHGFAVDGEGRKMSKSKGNVVAPQKVVGHAGRRDPAPVGRRDRLFGRAVDLRRNPEARRRKLSAHPQHAALPDREHRRLRSGSAMRVAGRDLLEIDRYALAQRARDGRRGRSRLRALRVPSRRAAAADVLLGGSRRLLSRRAQGPAVHGRRGQRRRAARRKPRSRTSATRC